MAQKDGTQTQPNGISVLLAEDDRYNSEVVSRFLMAVGYNVAVAQDGFEALEMAQAERPDIVLMDIRMPNLSGLEVIRRLRATPELSRIPIIVVTALAMPDDRFNCLAAGADEYLSKPFRLVELRKVIEKQLANAQEKASQLYPMALKFCNKDTAGLTGP